MANRKIDYLYNGERRLTADPLDGDEGAATYDDAMKSVGFEKVTDFGDDQKCEALITIWFRAEASESEPHYLIDLNDESGEVALIAARSTLDMLDAVNRMLPLWESLHRYYERHDAGLVRFKGFHAKHGHSFSETCMDCSPREHMESRRRERERLERAKAKGPKC